MPSEESKQLIATMRSQPALPGGSLAEMRAGMEATARSADADIIVEDTTAGGVPAKYFTAPGADTSRVLLYLHGGGYVLGSTVSHAWLLGELSRATDVQVLALDYRLAPEHPFPAAVEDAVAGYRSLLDSGIAARDIAIGGDSAGGGLTAATLVSLKERGLPMPSAGVLLSPWTDLAATGASITERATRDPLISDVAMIKMMADNYIGGDKATNPLVSPHYADLSGLPPLLIQVGTEEVLYDDSTRLHERAKAAGVESTFEPWDGQVHVFQMQGWMVPEGQQAIDQIGEFVKAKLGALAAV
ncbi:MAG: alpha/beta hydrolase [Dehalococcoidia bacterium]